MDLLINNEGNGEMDKEKTGFSWVKLLYTLICILVLGGFVTVLIGSVLKAVNLRETEVFVTEKGTKRSGSTEKYLIYCVDDNGESRVFEITDSLFARRFNSSDLYAEVKEGHRYKMLIAGYRVSFFSWYPNIYNVEDMGRGFKDDPVLHESKETESE